MTMRASTAMSQEEAELLTKGLFDFREPRGRDLAGRCEAFREWVDASSAHGYFQFLRSHVTAAGPVTEVVGWGGQHYTGINLASQDYLGLASHPDVKSAAAAACLRSGTHSSGSEPMGGGFADAKHLERELGELIGRENVVLFPTGWAAGYGAIKSLIRPYDHVVLDALAHDCLQHGAQAATPNVSIFLHNDVESLRIRLGKVRKVAPNEAILVVTESLFSMDSDHADLRRLIETCREFGASIMVDVAHDLGLLGPGGRGTLAEAGVLADVDFLVGAFSKVFASTGGFFAAIEKAPTYYARGYSGSYTFSNYVTPPQVAAVREALRIVRSPEGDLLRRATLDRADYLRSALERAGMTVLGRASALVLPFVGDEALARVAYRSCLETGLILNNIEFPACRRRAARFRMQVSPLHTFQALDEAVVRLEAALALGRTMLGHSGGGP